MPGLKKTSTGSGNQEWMGSVHGLTEAQTGSLVKSAFDAQKYFPGGFIRSGTEVNAADLGNVKPWTGAAGEQLGYVVRDITVEGDDTHIGGVGIMLHGLVRIEKLPIPHVEAADAKSVAAFVLQKEAR